MGGLRFNTLTKMPPFSSSPRALKTFVIPVPAKAGNTGTQEVLATLKVLSWVPDSRFALSGMTKEEGLLRRTYGLLTGDNTGRSFYL
jgi:hypothetical protein